MSVRFNQYTGSGRYITIVSPVGSYCYPYIDDIRVDYIRPCARIENVSLSYITSDSAMLRWSALGVTDYQYVFGPEGFNPDTLVPQDLHADSIILTSLTPNTGYDFYVRALCPSGDTSGWSNAFTFRTECLLLDTMYFTESFENVPFGWGSSSSTKFYPCWTRENNPYDSYYYPYIYNYDAHHVPIVSIGHGTLTITSTPSSPSPLSTPRLSPSTAYRFVSGALTMVAATAIPSPFMSAS